MSLLGLILLNHIRSRLNPDWDTIHEIHGIERSIRRDHHVPALCWVKRKQKKQPVCLCACVYSSSLLSLFGQYPLGGVRHNAMKSGEVGGGEGKGGAEERRYRKRENSILKPQWALEMYFTLYWLFLFVYCCYLFCQAAYVWNWSKSHSLRLHQCCWIELIEEKQSAFLPCNEYMAMLLCHTSTAEHQHFCCSGCRSSFLLAFYFGPFFFNLCDMIF